ncbi:MAG: cupin domain-containing protein [Acidobacteria bacterium]|nr:cupin domain-containing protein [Acidobacteriota bacterium]
MDNKALFVNLEESFQYAEKGIVSKTLFDSPKMKIVLFCFEEGQSLSEHQAPFNAQIVVLEGEGDFLLGGEKFKGQKGALFFMPEGLIHAIKATKRLSFVLTLVK